MLQNNYGFKSQIGTPGGLYDSSPHSIISRANGEEDSKALGFGFGVVQGDTPGTDVKLPTEGSTAGEFEGVAVSGIAERDLDGTVRINPTKVIGLLSWGKVWVRVPAGETVVYGAKAYLIKSGDDAGKFTSDDTNGIDVNAKFISAVDSDNIAAIELKA